MIAYPSKAIRNTSPATKESSVSRLAALLLTCFVAAPVAAQSPASWGERLAIAVDALAMAEAAVVETLEYTRERLAFGKPILDFQNTRFELAHCKTQVMATRTFIDHCIEREIAGELDAVTASMAKLQATDMLDDVVDRCLQLFGGYGYMMEYPITQKFAAARVMRIYGGTNEIMKEVIGRAL